jgi:hypothetical protein
MCTDSADFREQASHATAQEYPVLYLQAQMVNREADSPYSDQTHSQDMIRLLLIIESGLETNGKSSS